MIEYKILGRYVFFNTRDEACNKDYLRSFFPKKKFQIIGGWIRTTSVGVKEKIEEIRLLRRANRPPDFIYLFFLDPCIPSLFARTFKTSKTLKAIAAAKAKFMKGLPKISEKILSQEKMF